MSRLVIAIALGLIAGLHLMAAIFRVDRIALLVSMGAVLVLVCAGIEWRRVKLRRWLDTLDRKERKRLAARDPEVRFSRPAWAGKSYIVTLLVGQLGVMLPLLPAFILPLWLVQPRFDPNEHPLINFAAVLAGFLVAWAWWSASVSLWRWWAMRYRDMSAQEVQWRGESGLLLWPAWHWCTRTALYAWSDARKRA